MKLPAWGRGANEDLMVGLSNHEARLDLRCRGNGTAILGLTVSLRPPQ